jgi:hypothetical protein
MTASICSGVSCSANEGMIREKPRPYPPCVIVAFQSTSSSGVVPAQSVKSGNVEGLSKLVDVCGAPSPLEPWHPAHPRWKISSPAVSSRVVDWAAAEACAAKLAAGTHNATQRMKRETADRNALLYST